MKRLFFLALCVLSTPGPCLSQVLRYTYEFSENRTEPLLSPGLPAVPKQTVRLLLPFGEELISARFDALPSVPGPEGDFAINPEPIPTCAGSWGLPVAKVDPKAPFPEAPLGAYSVVIEHGYRILYADLFPLQYSRSTGQSRFFPGGELVLETRPTRQKTWFRGLPSDLSDVNGLIDSIPQNQGTLLSYPLSRMVAATDYLVVAPQSFLDDSTANSLTRLLADKNSRGLHTATLSLEDIQSHFSGSDIQEKTRNAIIQYYQYRGIQYVLLVGDGYSILPTRALTVNLSDGTKGTIPSDFYFACLDGDFKTTTADVACEVAVGRAPVSNLDDMHAFVSKTLAMQALSDSDPRLRNELNFGEKMDDTTLGSQLIDQLITGGSAGTFATVGYPSSMAFQKMYETFSTPFSDVQAIQALNAGQFYTVNHAGHADVRYCMRFSSEQVSQLNNPLPFFEITQGCYSADLSRPNWASTMVVSPTGGAGAMVANSNLGYYNQGTSDGPSNRFHLAFYDTVFRDHETQLGKILFKTKTKLIPQVQSDNYLRWVVYETNLLGDPELRLKLGQ